MSNASIKNMTIGQTERVHVKAYAQDNADSPNPSQVADSTTTLVVTSVNPAIASAQVDPADPRAVLITALVAGTGQVMVNESPGLATANRLLLDFQVTAAPADNRRIDFLTADDPTP